MSLFTKNTLKKRFFQSTNAANNFIVCSRSSLYWVRARGSKSGGNTKKGGGEE